MAFHALFYIHFHDRIGEYDFEGHFTLDRIWKESGSLVSVVFTPPMFVVLVGMGRKFMSCSHCQELGHLAYWPGFWMVVCAASQLACWHNSRQLTTTHKFPPQVSIVLNNLIIGLTVNNIRYRIRYIARLTCTYIIMRKWHVSNKKAFYNGRKLLGFFGWHFTTNETRSIHFFSCLKWNFDAHGSEFKYDTYIFFS